MIFFTEEEICEFVDTDGLKRKLTRKLSVDEDGDGSEWEVLYYTCACAFSLVITNSHHVEQLNRNLVGSGW